MRPVSHPRRSISATRSARSSCRAILDRCDGTIELLEEGGLPLGAFDFGGYPEAEVDLAPGDVLLLYTDGVSEATNENGRFYGEQRMVKLLQQNARESAKVITAIMLEDVQKFNALGTQSDDKTILTIKRTG